MDDVKVSGPLFDGRAAVALQEGIRAARKDLADEGRKLAIAAFTGQLRRDTGRFLHSITTTGSSRAYTTASGHKSYTLPVVVEDTATDILVTTDLASYGPWLEGTGSRNETTRFKGYHGFRRAGEQLERVARAITERTLNPYVERMN